MSVCECVSASMSWRTNDIAPPTPTHAVGQKEEFKDSRFQYAVDLVRYLREEYGDYFGIAVAGW